MPKFLRGSILVKLFIFDYQDSDYYGEGDYIFQEYFGISLGVDLGYKFVNYNNF